MFDDLSEGDGPAGGNGVIKRIVFDRHDLRGRTVALANALDDRVVEIFKIALRGMAKNHGAIPMGDTTSVVNLVGADGDSLEFELEYDGEVMTAALPRGGYEMYADALSRSSAAGEQAYVVDRAFAGHLIDVIKDGAGVGEVSATEMDETPADRSWLTNTSCNQLSYIPIAATINSPTNE